MSRTILLVTAASVLLASAAPAAAPQFDTPAKVAYLIDLSSGATLYAKTIDEKHFKLMLFRLTGMPKIVDQW